MEEISTERTNTSVVPNTYKLTIYCDKFPTLKNSKQILVNRKTKVPFISASEDWAEWKVIATLQINSWRAICKHPLPFKRCSISMICFFPDFRIHDLDGIQSGVLDLLKVTRKKDKKTKIVYESGCRIITDDDWKLLRPISIDAGYSPQTPRIEVFITPIDDLSFRTK